MQSSPELADVASFPRQLALGVSRFCLPGPPHPPSISMVSRDPNSSSLSSTDPSPQLSAHLILTATHNSSDENRYGLGIGMTFKGRSVC